MVVLSLLLAQTNGTRFEEIIIKRVSHLLRHYLHPFAEKWKVERRRRETINEGINELAKIVPGCEKNKGSILQRAVNYILQLKTAQDKSNETRALEKVVLEQVVDELSGRVDNLKKELKNAWAENERIKAENIKLKRTLANANVQVEGGDDAIGEMENGEDT